MVVFLFRAMALLCKFRLYDVRVYCLKIPVGDCLLIGQVLERERQPCHSEQERGQHPEGVGLWRDGWGDCLHLMMMRVQITALLHENKTFLRELFVEFAEKLYFCNCESNKCCTRASI